MKKLIKHNKCPDCKSQDIKQYTSTMLECNCCKKIFKSHILIEDKTAEEAARDYIRTHRIPDHYDNHVIKAFIAGYLYKENIGLL